LELIAVIIIMSSSLPTHSATENLVVLG